MTTVQESKNNKQCKESVNTKNVANSADLPDSTSSNAMDTKGAEELGRHMEGFIHNHKNDEVPKEQIVFGGVIVN